MRDALVNATLPALGVPTAAGIVAPTAPYLTVKTRN